MSIPDELAKLQHLHQSGALTDDEYAAAKARLIAPNPLGNLLGGGATQEQQTRQWAMWLHLSQFLGFAVPGAGFVVPIVIWQIKKDELPELDEHGRIVTNWIISELLYAVVCFALFVVLIGIPLLIVLGVLGIVFPLLGAIKASGGEAWRYPLTIRFL